MRAAVLLSALFAARAAQAAVPEAGSLARRALPPDGFAATVLELLLGPAQVPTPRGVPVVGPRPWRAPATDTTQVALAPLLDRHWHNTDSLRDAHGTTLLAGTLDFNGDGYVAITTPNGASRFVKIERGMTGRWNVGARVYEISLNVNILRPRLANIIQIKDAVTRQLVWERRINELFRLTYAAGEPVTLAGRPYSLFYSHLPDPATKPAVASLKTGLAFIFEEPVNGGRDVEYRFYLVPVDQLLQPAPVPYRMFGGDLLRFHVPADLSVLNISR